MVNLHFGQINIVEEVRGTPRNATIFSACLLEKVYTLAFKNTIPLYSKHYTFSEKTLLFFVMWWDIQFYYVVLFPQLYQINSLNNEK